MLVIGRKVGESILVSDNIKITIISLGGDKVGIGIEAPKEIPIMREELVETTLANLEASEINKTSIEKDLALLFKRSKNK